MIDNIGILVVEMSRMLGRLSLQLGPGSEEVGSCEPNRCLSAHDSELFVLSLFVLERSLRHSYSANAAEETVAAIAVLFEDDPLRDLIPRRLPFYDRCFPASGIALGGTLDQFTRGVVCLLRYARNTGASYAQGDLDAYIQQTSVAAAERHKTAMLFCWLHAYFARLIRHDFFRISDDAAGAVADGAFDSYAEDGTEYFQLNVAPELLAEEKSLDHFARGVVQDVRCTRRRAFLDRLFSHFHSKTKTAHESPQRKSVSKEVCAFLGVLDEADVRFNKPAFQILRQHIGNVG